MATDALIRLTLTATPGGRIRLDGERTVADVYVDGAPLILRLAHRPTFSTPQHAIAYVMSTFNGKVGVTRNGGTPGYDIMVYDRT
ncbi:MAG: hypothetical protein ABIJ75_07240 [Actinomycetota bacterium]